tara:strand:+ start:229 stop:651 length:423 start_codon:yes stop_codon:yes gene_type:complete
VHQIIFVGAAESVADMEADENPANEFPCMSSQQFHRGARAQLYALVTGSFLDEAYDLEVLDQTLALDGPYIYRLDMKAEQALAELNEDQVEEISQLWMSCEEIEQLDLVENDLHEFLFLLIHFCQIARNDDLGVYIYSDD